MAVVAGAMLAGTAISALGNYESGQAASREANLAAQYEDQNANAAFAGATRAAYFQRQYGNQMVGNARAAIAAGGGSTQSAQSLQLLNNIDRRVEYNTLGTIYQGKMQQLAMQRNAQAMRDTGKNTAMADNYAAVGSVISGAGRTYMSYNAPGAMSYGY